MSIWGTLGTAVEGAISGSGKQEIDEIQDSAPTDSGEDTKTFAIVVVLLLIGGFGLWAFLSLPTKT